VKKKKSSAWWTAPSWGEQNPPGTGYPQKHLLQLVPGLPAEGKDRTFAGSQDTAAIEEPKFYKVTHSYVFGSHPYFNGHFKSGQLAITEKIYTDEKWNGNLTDIKLWFEVDNEEDTKKSFKQLTDTFSSFKNVLTVRLMQSPKQEKTKDSCLQSC
jgi:hypothetical protein